MRVVAGSVGVAPQRGGRREAGQRRQHCRLAWGDGKRDWFINHLAINIGEEIRLIICIKDGSKNLHDESDSAKKTVMVEKALLCIR